MKSSQAPVGVFGGTFDPIHFGHLRLAQEVAEYCGLESVRIIPAGNPPHRNAPHCNPARRMEMAAIAARGNPILVPDDRETGKTSPCYSVETLLELRSEFGREKPICLMVGADAFLGLPSWHRWTEIFDLAHILVAQRPGFDVRKTMSERLGGEFSARMSNSPDELSDLPCGRIMTIDITLLDISASMIRDCFARGGSARYLLPDAVLDYILDNDLYQEKHEP